MISGRTLSILLAVAVFLGLKLLQVANIGELLGSTHTSTHTSDASPTGWTRKSYKSAPSHRPTPILTERRKAAHRYVLSEYNRRVSLGDNPLEWAKTMFAENGTFTNANNHPTMGHENIAAGAMSIYKLVRKVDLVSMQLFHLSVDEFISEGVVTYTMLDGKVLPPIPILAKFTLVSEQNIIMHYRSYVDKTPMLVAAGLDVTVSCEGLPMTVPRRCGPLCGGELQTAVCIGEAFCV